MVGEELSDAWAHPTITNRDQFKTIMRQCYGSQLTPAEMWREMKIPFTREEELAFNHELYNGDLAIANAFKNFIISNCNPQPEMELHVLNRKIKTYCNRFNNVGETTNEFDLFDTHTGRIRRVKHTDTIKVPDLKAFRRYMVTALIHGTDGNNADNTSAAIIATYGWCLSIHDAFILCPEAVDFARNHYAKRLEYVHTNRNEILTNYFQSIGIPASAMKEWKEEVAPLIEPLTGAFICNPMTLK